MIRGLRLAALALFAALAATPGASAAPGGARSGAPLLTAAPARGLSDGRMLLSSDPDIRVRAIAVAQRLGATVVRVPIVWRLTVTDRGFDRPAGDLADPGAAAYDWRRLDASMRDVAAAGLQPIAYFVGAPAWAESAPRYPWALPGTWAPRPADLAAFATAAARRYSGSWPDPLIAGSTLPRIARFQPWNEPNLPRYLQPQWVRIGGKLQPFSSRWYSAMHAAVEQAIHAVQPDAIVATAGLAPTGDQRDGGIRMAPVRWWQDFLCLRAPPSLEPRTGCRVPAFDAVAVHPLSVRDPDRPAEAPMDFAISDLRTKILAPLRRARQLGVAANRATPLWVTELNWTAGAGIRGSVGAVDQADFIARALQRLAAQGAQLVDWQFAVDPPRERTRGVRRPAGLTTAASGDPRIVPGADKPFARGFAVPFVAQPIGNRRVAVWVGAHRSATIEALRGGRWRAIARLGVTAPNSAAAGIVRVDPGTMLRARLRSRSGGPAQTYLASAPVRVGATTVIARAASSGAEAGVAPAERAAEPATPSIVVRFDPREPDPGSPRFAPVPPLVADGSPSPSLVPIIPVVRPLLPTSGTALTTVGTAGDDLLVGGPGDDVIDGRGGNDVILGLSGNDLLIGGSGDDLLVGGGGEDAIAGGPGRNRIVEP